MAASEQILILLKAKDEASKVIDGVSRSASGMARTASLAAAAAGAATVAAIGGITAAIGVGVKKAADLEQGVADIASVMGITFDEAKPLKDLISQLGMDPTLKVNAVEASDAIMQLAQSGMSMQQILDGAARSTVLLSNATGGDMATSAAIASDAMALFGINAADMATAVNGITGVTVASKFGINDYQLALSQAGGVASAVGVSFADFNTTIAAISPYFASGSDAGTSFKTFLQRLIPTSADAESAMQALGLVTAEGANQFFNADGTMRSMSEISGLLAGALAGLTEEQKNTALSTIFGTDAMRAAVGLAEAGTGKFGELAASIAGIDAEASAATRMDTLSGAMEILQGMIDGVLTKIGDKFLPIARQFTDWAIQLVDEHGPAVVAWFGGLAEAVPPFINYVQALLMDGDYLNDWLTHLPDGIRPVVVWFGNVAAVLRDLVLWLATGDPGHILTNFQQLWERTAATIGEMFNSVVAYARSKWPEWVDTLQSWGGLFAAWAGALWGSWILPGLGDMWESLKGWLDDKADGLGTHLEEWTGGFLGVTGDIGAGWREAWPDIAQIVSDAAGEIGASISGIIENLNRIGAWFDPGGEGGEFAVTWADFWKFLTLTLAATLEGIVTGIEITVQAFVALGEAIAALGTLDMERLGGAAGMAGHIATIMGDFMADMTRRINSAFPARAAGGPVTGGHPYMVGELGPELFVPNSSGQIVPNNQITTTNNYTVNLVGGNNAGSDIMASLRLVTALYG